MNKNPMEEPEDKHDLLKKVFGSNILLDKPQKII
jgi:hypothetical protein